MTEFTEQEKEIFFEHIEEMTKKLTAINQHLMFYSIVLIFAVIAYVLLFISSFLGIFGI